MGGAGEDDDEDAEGEESKDEPHTANASTDAAAEEVD